MPNSRAWRTTFAARAAASSAFDGTQPTRPLHDGGEIDAHGTADLNAEVAGAANLVGGARGGQQRLGRHTADVEAVAAEEVFLDQGDARPQAGGPGGADQARRAGADDDEVVVRRRLGVDPVRRMHVADQLTVERVRRRDLERLGRHR